MVDKKHTSRHRVLALGRALALSFAAVASSVVAADERPSRLAQPLSPSQNVIIENTNISMGEFWDAYKGENPEHRRQAQLFLLGVLDATEGVSWCDYSKFKTGTIAERIYENLKDPINEKRAHRAAREISQLLTKSYPCGRKK